MSGKQFAIGAAVTLIVTALACYLAILGIGVLYHNGDPLIRDWFGP
jgi:hypothetical protein